MNANDYLIRFERWNELSEQISDVQASKYVTCFGTFLFSKLFKVLTLGGFAHPRDLIAQQDLEGRAKLLHEKEEIFQLATERRCTIDEVVEAGSFGIGFFKRTLADEAHAIAVDTELQFYTFVSEQLGYSSNFGSLSALTSPFYQVRYLWSPWRVHNLAFSSDENISGIHALRNPSKEEVMKAIKIHEDFGAKYKHCAEQIYTALHSVINKS